MSRACGLRGPSVAGLPKVHQRSRRAAFQPIFAKHAGQATSIKAEQSDRQSPQRSFLQEVAIGLVTAAAVALPISVTQLELPPPAHARLIAGDPVKNAQAILRNALPIDNKPIREIQRELESISEALRIPGSKSLGPVARSERKAGAVLSGQKQAIVAAFNPSKKAEGQAAISKLETALGEFNTLIDEKDKQLVPIKQRECLTYVGQIEEAMVKAFPFQIPAEYANRPLLKGRADLEMRVKVRETPEGAQDVIMNIVLDGYNAPVSAGQFMDLVNRKFYDGMEIQRADGFVVQTGDPEGQAEGFVDPDTKEIRRVPFEVRIVGQNDPIYEINLEDLGMYQETPVLPFNAYGTLAMARAEFDNNSASSQVFFLLKESELTPTGANLLDGRYAVFGYVVEGQDNLAYMKVGDKIDYIKVVSGNDNLVNGYKGSKAKAVAAAPAAAAEEVAPPEA